MFICGVSAQTERISVEMTRGEKSNDSERANLNKPNPQRGSGGGLFLEMNTEHLSDSQLRVT